MSDTQETPVDVGTPKTRSVFWMVYGVLMVIGNLIVLVIAWNDKSWGALWIAIVGGPILNAVFLISGLVAISVLRRRTPFSLGRHLAMSIGLPIAAIVVDFLVIILMAPHGC
jgi:hypothetical protein